MKNEVKKERKTAANFTLEAALIIVPVLLVFITLLFIMYAKLIALDIRYAVENIAEELAVIFPLADSLAEDSSGKLGEILNKYLLAEDRSILDKLAGDYASSLFLEPLLEHRLDYYLQDKYSSGGFSLKEQHRQILLDWASNGKSLRLDVFVYLPTYFGKYEQKISALIPLWSQRLQSGKEEDKTEGDEQADSIWEADNFTRGRYFRDKEGANLPLNYPVIASFKNGRAKAIKSMDLTAPSYQSPQAAVEAVRQHLDKLANFKGKEFNSTKLPSIKESEIVAKDFVLIVPKNLPENYSRHFFNGLQAEAEALGLNFTYKQLGKSKRYVKDE